MLIEELKETLLYQSHIFQDPYFESFQIHRLTMMSRFEHTNHDVLLNLLFQNLYQFFLSVRICISNMFHI